MTSVRIPLATYRLQFHKDFRFADARRLVPYLHALGITDLYASPIFTARAGSLHGYDVTDHTVLNPELGTEEELQELLAELRRYGMGFVLDVVPNHMCVDGSNRWWGDVLENGPSSPYARFFDIDWHPPKPDLVNKVLLPVLSNQYGKVLESGELRLVYDAGGLFVSYGTTRFPVAPRTWTAILEPTLIQLRRDLSADDPQVVELESIITSLQNLPLRTETMPERVRERQREKEVARRRLATLVEANGALRRALDEVITQMNGRQGDSASFDRLEALLADQAYRLSFWRVAADEINYRRFFDINELAAIHVEDPEVFEAVHTLVFRLLRDGSVTGLRIDHPDGLFDPEQYFADLQQTFRTLTETGCTAPNPPSDGGDLAGYVVAEKILCRDERLRTTWKIHGTTGYDFLNLLNGVFVDTAHERAVRTLYSRLTGVASNFEDLTYASKKLILDVSMSGELHVLARRLDRISEQHRWSRDFTLASLQEALSEVIACFPIYRTYIRASSNVVSEEDRRHILAAIRAAKRRNPATSESLFDFIASVLLLEDPEGLRDAEVAARRDFVMRFQQITAPVMAKGFEDTACYRAYPLASLNEVGGDPRRFGVSVEEFHRRNAERLTHWRGALLATSTHDTKRSEDVRSRINVLSEIPEEWERAVKRWQSWNREAKTTLDGSDVPDANEEYLLYQTLVGTWSLEPMDEPGHDVLVQRIERYMEKALREAKLHTSWVNPSTAYEQAVAQFVRAVLSPNPENQFLEDFRRFIPRIAYAGSLHALSQTLLKVTSPGVPDFYQGTELWELSLVDPDNRRPVDFATRAARLEELKRRESEDLHAVVEDLLTHWEDGWIKLYVTSKCLQFRQQRQKLFLDGDYVPLEAFGNRKRHLCAFARRMRTSWVLVVVPRLLARLVAPGKPPLGEAVWGDNALVVPKDAPERWHHVLTGDTVTTGSHGAWWKTVPLALVFEHCPVALLEGSSA